MEKSIIVIAKIMKITKKRMKITEKLKRVKKISYYENFFQLFFSCVGLHTWPKKTDIKNHHHKIHQNRLASFCVIILQTRFLKKMANFENNAKPKHKPLEN